MALTFHTFKFLEKLKKEIKKGKKISSKDILKIGGVTLLATVAVALGSAELIASFQEHGPGAEWIFDSGPGGLWGWTHNF